MEIWQKSAGARPKDRPNADRQGANRQDVDRQIKRDLIGYPYPVSTLYPPCVRLVSGLDWTFSTGAGGGLV